VILYKKLNKRICQEYSRFKFGDPTVIKKYTVELTRVISKYIEENKAYIIHATAKSPLTKYCKKNSLILSERVAQKLKLSLIIGEYSYHYSRKKYYENVGIQERCPHPPIFKTKAKLKIGCHVLMIDDAIFTGKSLKASVNLFKNIADEVILFSIINLQKQKCSEKEINSFYYEEQGLSFLLKLLKNENYTPTTHFIRTVDALEERNKKKLVDGLDEKQKKLLKKAFKIYADKNLLKN